MSEAKPLPGSEGCGLLIGRVLPYLVLLALAYVVLARPLFHRLDAIAAEQRRSNLIECIRLDNEGTDSFGQRDRDACG